MSLFCDGVGFYVAIEDVVFFRLCPRHTLALDSENWAKGHFSPNTDTVETIVAGGNSDRTRLLSNGMA